MVDSVALLGSTGSIGTQTLDVARTHGVAVRALAANSDIATLEAQIREFRPALCAVADEDAARDLRVRVADTATRVLSGSDGVLDAARIDCGAVVNAIVGRAGLAPTIAAIEVGNTLALANKESLVCAGVRVMALAREKRVRILPVDSEHSAIFQCLQGAAGNKVRRVILTASGGPFRGMTRDALRTVTREDALRHPSWSMGAKITVDSATMMNKGLEFIEAMRLFDLEPQQISVVVHPQSVVHSAVEFEDGAVIAQLGTPDMRLPIQYALSYPERLPSPAPTLELAQYGALTFEEPDLDAFPALALAMRCAPLGDEVCGALNDANETAVAQFLSGEIAFYEIFERVNGAIAHIIRDM
ncbi:MAG: 1-deoxy-D-xylulose-5-phosphate reductoisomerase [Oscillospiraceae bacterium]|jgi:1-deoxy-D-xylulose-5-phosphate reductoisomerase|nr:1-deoxy-D-xylulose-5-phosphate reductoisomerase [Oscillospiraceae bacterium]